MIVNAVPEVWIVSLSTKIVLDIVLPVAVSYLRCVVFCAVHSDNSRYRVESLPPFHAVTETVAETESVVWTTLERDRPAGAPLGNVTVNDPEYPSLELQLTEAEVWLPDTLNEVLFRECVPREVPLPVAEKLVEVPFTVNVSVSEPHTLDAAVKLSDIPDKVTVLPLRDTLPVRVPFTAAPDHVYTLVPLKNVAIFTPYSRR